tara:strand:- start:419 stop:856 length:438 start_codon:yes stop_codon:yes gene_type:complete
MITPEKFNKIVAKLPKDKTELAKVELSVADDLKKVVASGKDMMTRIKKFKDEIKADNKLNSDLDKTIKTRVKASNKLVNSAESFKKVIDKEKDKINDVGVKAFKIAKELGVDPNNIKGYSESEKLENDLMGNRDLINLFKGFDWV